MKMRPEDRERWTSALRSGEFSQGEGYLHQQPAPREDRYCCLGVYAAVSGLSSRLFATSGRYAYKYTFPSPGAEVEDGAVIPLFWGISQGISEDAIGELVRMNDIEGRSFEYIAEWIDTNL